MTKTEETQSTGKAQKHTKRCHPNSGKPQKHRENMMRVDASCADTQRDVSTRAHELCPQGFGASRGFFLSNVKLKRALDWRVS